MCDHSPNREAAMVVIADGIWCDPCLVPLVKALNEGGIRTVASCCGHGKNAGSIGLADGRWLVIADEPPSRDQTEDGLAERVRALADDLEAEAAEVEQDGTPEQEVEQFFLAACSARARALLADQSDTTASEEDQR